MCDNFVTLSRRLHRQFHYIRRLIFARCDKDIPILRYISICENDLKWFKVTDDLLWN